MKNVLLKRGASLVALPWLFETSLPTATGSRQQARSRHTFAGLLFVPMDTSTKAALILQFVWILRAASVGLLPVLFGESQIWPKGGTRTIALSCEAGCAEHQIENQRNNKKTDRRESNPSDPNAKQTNWTQRKPNME